MSRQTAVEDIAQNIIKYAFVDKEKARIELSIPFELWNEVVNKALCMEKEQIHISDEEIEKAAEDWQEFRQGAGKESFEKGAKWYREQIKNK